MPLDTIYLVRHGVSILNSTNLMPWQINELTKPLAPSQLDNRSPNRYLQVAIPNTDREPRGSSVDVVRHNPVARAFYPYKQCGISPEALPCLFLPVLPVLADYPTFCGGTRQDA